MTTKPRSPRAILMKMFQGCKTDYEKYICCLPNEVLDLALSELREWLREQAGEYAGYEAAYAIYEIMEKLK